MSSGQERHEHLILEQTPSCRSRFASIKANAHVKLLIFSSPSDLVQYHYSTEEANMCWKASTPMLLVK